MCIRDSYYTINEAAAKRAKDMNSFSDYKQGSATAEYRHYVDAVSYTHLDTQKPVFDKDGKPVTEEKEIKIPAFRVVSVFDISQTEGKELPALTYELTGNVEQYKDFFAALEKTSPFAMGFEALSGGVKGRCNYEEKRIFINEGMDELQNIKTAIHEICLLYTSRCV